MKRFIQFIAGAICPSCKEKDTIAINSNDDEIYCVKCDYVEKRPIAEKTKISENINVINLEDFKKNRDKN
ncbi:MAG: YheV family putative metal-binding protein [Gammaproteobacteria bacterium]|jgi:uncharacterized metal-binding protein (TIGR02443 family)|tara:strand:- start:1159 stop:1368 length:210 start_codon:yes stop_codon:yes gene_type:complete